MSVLLAGLNQSAGPVLDQLRYRNQLEAEVGQGLDDDLAGFSRGDIKLMHQDDIAVLHVDVLAEHGVDGGCRLSCFPVQGIDAPGDDRHLHGIPDGVCHDAAGQAEDSGLHAADILNRLVALQNIVDDFLRTQLIIVFMRIGMVGYLESFFGHALYFRL